MFAPKSDFVELKDKPKPWQERFALHPERKKPPGLHRAAFSFNALQDYLNL
jgi:hypothetical protein